MPAGTRERQKRGGKKGEGRSARLLWLSSLRCQERRTARVKGKEKKGVGSGGPSLFLLAFPGWASTNVKGGEEGWWGGKRKKNRETESVAED